MSDNDHRLRQRNDHQDRDIQQNVSKIPERQEIRGAQADNNSEDQYKNDDPDFRDNGPLSQTDSTGGWRIIYGHIALPVVTVCVAAEMIFSCVASARVKCPVI